VNGRNVDMFEAGLFGGGGEDHEKGPQPPCRRSVLPRWAGS
jgi:hypothetical protein